jgi:hypothetical protein
MWWLFQSLIIFAVVANSVHGSGRRTLAGIGLAYCLSDAIGEIIDWIRTPVHDSETSCWIKWPG